MLNLSYKSGKGDQVDLSLNYNTVVTYNMLYKYYIIILLNIVRLTMYILMVIG